MSELSMLSLFPLSVWFWNYAASCQVWNQTSCVLSNFASNVVVLLGSIFVKPVTQKEFTKFHQTTSYFQCKQVLQDVAWLNKLNWDLVCHTTEICFSDIYLANLKHGKGNLIWKQVYQNVLLFNESSASYTYSPMKAQLATLTLQWELS